MVRLVRLNRSGWAATGRLVGGRRSLTGAQWRGMRLQLSDLDAKLRLSELGRRRSKKLSPAQRKEIASLGGKALWANLSPEERSAQMKKVAAARKRGRRKSKS